MRTANGAVTIGGVTSRRSTAAPRVRRPRGGTYGRVRILYVEGRGYYIEPTDPTLLVGQPPLGLIRRWEDALRFVESGAAEALLDELLARSEAA